MLEAFVEPKPNGMECCHNDGDCTNNILLNLRWGTHRDNEDDKIKHGQIVCEERHGMHKLKKAEVELIKKLLAHKISQRIIAKIFNMCFSAINHINTGRTWGTV
jgi:hypothetical protein